MNRPRSICTPGTYSGARLVSRDATGISSPDRNWGSIGVETVRNMFDNRRYMSVVFNELCRDLIGGGRDPNERFSNAIGVNVFRVNINKLECSR